MATTKKNIDTGETVIRIEGMHKWFGNFHTLKDIDLQVFQGEKIVICGPSGSGKSADPLHQRARDTSRGLSMSMAPT